jgi:group II intron reverse transcriptase/maturase
MQTAEVVLGVLRERGRKGLPCMQLYRQMFNKDLYLLAYGNIYSNSGAMTPGAGGETADGMSEDKIDQIIEAMRREKYRFAPARRTYIPEKNGKLRPLGMPSWSGKLVGEVVRLLLEAYYEPQFSDDSHGFRRERGCHSALRKINDTRTGTTWFIEGDISDCFGSLGHEILLRILAEKIHDNRFLRLVRNMLKAGYLEDWEYYETLSGVPQGGVASPILSNIYLHKLDEFVGQELIPQYTRGACRKTNPEYKRVSRQLESARQRGDRAAARDLRKQLRALPAVDPMDPGYRRLKDIRYADDHILGIYRAEGRSRADQGQAGRVPPGDPRAGTEPAEDPDHPRPQPAGAVPRLPHQGPALRREDHQGPAGNQREDRAAGTARRDQDPVRPLPGTRQAVAPVPAPEPRRLRHREDLRSRVPGRGELLPARPGRLAAGHPARARHDVHAEDPGCAMRRTAISPAQRAEMRGDYLWI